jgi:hypothetical protein
VSVQETMSSQLAPLIVTTMVPPLEPVPPPVPAVADPDNCPLAPAQMITSLPAFTTGFEQGGVGQLTEYDMVADPASGPQTYCES